MTRFSYRAIPTGGSAGVIAGRLEAADEQSLRRRLRDEGLIPLDIQPLGVLDALRAALGGRGGVRRTDRAWFFQTLRRLLAGKVPIESALGTMETLAPNPRLVAACSEVRDALRSGGSVADAVERVPSLANAQHRALLRVGHESGRLEHVVGLIDRSLENRARVRRTVVGRLTYPAILLVVAALAVWFLASFVLPRFAETLQSAGAELPMSTRATLAAAEWLIWIAPLLLIGGVVFALSRPFSRLPALRRTAQEWGLRLPVVRQLVWHAQGGVVAETLATILEGGGDLLVGLEQAEQAVSLDPIRDRLAAARKRVREGDDVGRALEEERVMPPMVAALVRVGVQSGDLAGGLRHASELCLEKQEELTSRLLTFLEPGIILLLAGVVGWVVYSLVSGMLTINAMGAQ